MSDSYLVWKILNNLQIQWMVCVGRCNPWKVNPSMHGLEVKAELETIAKLEPIKPH